jgi:hypothetical protein
LSDPRKQADDQDQASAGSVRRSLRSRWLSGLLLVAVGGVPALPACGTEFDAAPDPSPAGAAGTTGGSAPIGGSNSGSAGANRGGTSAGTSASGGSFQGNAGEGGSSGAGTGEGGSDGPGAGGAGGENGAPRCDPGALSEGCVLAEDAGIFVSPDGDDDASGSRTRPLRSITEAVERVRSLAQPRPIFVCSATYAENVVIRGDGTELLGGFACPTTDSGEWIFDSAERARITPTSAGPALRVRDVDGFTLAHFVIQSRDAIDPDENSVAAFVSGSDAVRFHSSTLIAGRGGDGSPGVYEPVEYVAQSALAGNGAVGASGGAMLACSCDAPATSLSRGGKGGDGGIAASAGSAGYPLGRGGGAGGQVQQCTTGGTGGRGTDTEAGANGGGAETLGVVTSSGWVPESGQPGEHGLPGQGGGGGGGALGASDGGGGGGACGGCGGHGAEGGRGGGASIGLLSLDSTITLESSNVQSGPGGNGGPGGVGQIGQAGGTGGTPTGMACPGGAGGKGGDGAASGGGAGGISVGIVWSGGEQPELSDTDIDFDEAGAGGLGGVPGENDGIPGIGRRIHAAT